MNDFFTFELILTGLVLGIIPGIIARKKGRNFWLWYLYGVAFFLIALVHSLLISKTPEQKRLDMLEQGYVECPFCKEFIKDGAQICPHCQKELKD